MSKLNPITVNVDEYLGVNKYNVDEGNPHIVLADHPDKWRFEQLVRVCPAALYKEDDAGEQHFDYAGCLECGTCRIVAGGGIVETWRFPGATMGIEYRYG